MKKMETDGENADGDDSEDLDYKVPWTKKKGYAGRAGPWRQACGRQRHIAFARLSPVYTVFEWSRG